MDWNVPDWIPYYWNYTFHGIIGPVSDENNLTDSRYIDSELVVIGLCDINGDRKVNLADKFAIDLASGSGPAKAASNSAPRTGSLGQGRTCARIIGFLVKPFWLKFLCSI